MKRLLAALMLLLPPLVAAQEKAPLALPKTTAEATDYRATTRHADVVAFCRALAAAAPDVTRLESLGRSAEGRDLPLLVLSKGEKAGKPVVLLIGNIHAGEVDGKEALLGFARSTVSGPDKVLLDDLVILIAPIFNADGNERIARGTRADQVGPEEGVGTRENAAGLDLNRDFVKLESPEARALVKAMRKWNPAVFVDAHTTNGSYHRHTLTYDGPRHPNAGARTIDFGNGLLIPGAAARMQSATGYVGAPYGNFDKEHKTWTTYKATPRYAVQYAGLRGCIPVLSESYAYAPFRDRVKASQEFIRGICYESAARKKELLAAVKVEPQQRIALRTKLAPTAESRTILGYVEDPETHKPGPNPSPRDYTVRLVSRMEPTLEVLRPAAYLFPPTLAGVVEILQRHGVQVQELREDIELDVETYTVDKVGRAPRDFQKHALTSVEASPRRDTRRMPAGTVVVKTAQPLGTLAALLLEPQSEDGLVTWNFFDAALAPEREFPVVRLPADVPLTTGAVRPLADERTMNRRLDLASQFGDQPAPGFGGNPVGGLAWLPDGEHFLQQKGGKLWKVHARSGRAEPSVETAKLAASLKAIPGADDDWVELTSRWNTYPMDPARTGALIQREGDLYLAHFDGSPAVRLTKSAGAKELTTFSPDGRHIAFVRGGNLFAVDLATQTEKQLTHDGGGSVLNGKADWVYFEEIFDRNHHAYWWSPDSKHIAFLRFDDAPVSAFAVVNHLPTKLNVENTPYPKSGDPNPLVQLGVVGLGGEAPKFVRFAGTDPKDFLISRVGWKPDGKEVYCYAQNRTQTWLDVCFAPTGGGTAGVVLRDTTRAWVDDTGPLHFLPDGSFLYASDRSGFRHLYRYRADGLLLHPVTRGEWEVRQVARVDADTGWVYFTATKDAARGASVCRARWDGTALQRLSNDGGTHSVSFSPDGELFIQTCSSLTEPTRVTLRAEDGSLVRTLDTNPVYVREEYRWGKVQPVEIPLADGFTLWGTLTYPVDFDPAKKYPVWVKTYAGPHMPSITDNWASGRADDHVLASLGIVVFRVDPRSASGQGRQSAWAAYRKLGVQELKDLESAVDWLAKNPWVDATRVGLSGHSYGGYMTAYALTHSTKFCAGVSGAPVTDWRNYDSVYTERYMGLPQENKDGYKASSVVAAARRLHGKLLLLHGLMDDNVHVQNSVQLIHELQRADKDFEVMVYPTARHGIFGRHYQRQVVNFIAKSLGVPGRVAARE